MKYSLYTTGGSGTGKVTFKITSGGTATGCQIGGTTYNYYLTASGIGTCLVTATKAGDINYFETTSVVTPVTIIFMQFINPFGIQSVGSGPTIGITVGLNWDTTSAQAPDVSNVQVTQGITGGSYKIYGTGFATVIEVKLNRKVVASFTIDSSTQVTFIPGALNGSGPLQVKNSAGLITYITDSFIILNPVISITGGTIVGTTGSAITPYAISNIGSAASSFALSGGTLPTGINFDATTGLISGTPTATLTATTFTVTASGGGGSTTATFTLTVN